MIDTTSETEPKKRRIRLVLIEMVHLKSRCRHMSGGGVWRIRHRLSECRFAFSMHASLAILFLLGNAAYGICWRDQVAGQLVFLFLMFTDKHKVVIIV